jgi:hexosaminidase
MKNGILVLSLLFCFTFSVASSNEKPFVIPELQSWVGAEGTRSIANNLVIEVVSGKAHAKRMTVVANQLADDLQILFGLQAQVGAGQKADIVLSIEAIPEKNKEAYEIEIGETVVVKANEPTGVLWATKTILQILEGREGKDLPKGKIMDHPEYPLRGFMLDVGRKFFTIDFLRDYVRFMAYYKMNTFHIHLSDNGFKQFYGNDWDKTYAAFRLESETYPGLAAKDGHYTKREFVDLQMLAEANGVLIIPEIDIPAHTLAFTQYLPELGSKEYGMDHLDLFNPETYRFFDQLFAEYLNGKNPVFRGEYVHIGTDEYSNKDPKVVEKFRYFMDYYIRQVEKHGKKAAVWGSLTHAKGETPVKVDDVLMDCWYNGYADPKDMIEKGYDVVSIPDGMVYIVPAAGYYYDYLNCEWLYKEWTPAKIGNAVFPENHPQIKGGKFAVWNDHCGNGITEKDVHHRVFPAMQTLSVKMWTGKNTTLPYDAFNKQRVGLSEAPGLNINARHTADENGLVLELNDLKAGDELAIQEIGYNYRVEFTLQAKNNLNGTVLFESPNAKVYLRHPESGKLAFLREGYWSEFDYIVPNDYVVTLAVEGTHTGTKLFVNGQLVDDLEKKYVHYNQSGKSRKAKMQTLVFPLAQIGNFKGIISNIKVNVLK